MRLIWTSEASDDLDQLIDYIREYSPLAAANIYRIIRDTADRIPEHPYMFRRGRREGTREAVVHPNYILIYRVLEDGVVVLGVLHTRQQYP